MGMRAANSAFQVHLSTTPEEFAPLFNAALLLSAPALAAAANSPTFLGKRLWDETRVALFKQSGDDRPTALDGDTALPPRVNFGNGWVREGAHELFLESVTLHLPLLPACSELDEATRVAERAGAAAEAARATAAPRHRVELEPPGVRPRRRWQPAHRATRAARGAELRGHAGQRELLVGAMLGIRDRMPKLVSALPFVLAKQNFFQAAQHGLDAALVWPRRSSHAHEGAARATCCSS